MVAMIKLILRSLFEVIDYLENLNKGQYFENILKICLTTYNWNETRTRSALTNATQQGFVIEIAFKGISTYRIPLLSRVPSSQMINNDGRMGDYDCDDKTDIEIIVEVIEYLENLNKGQYFENILKICLTTYNWNETRTRSALTNATQQGFVVEITIRGTTTYRIPQRSRGPSYRNIDNKGQTINDHMTGNIKQRSDDEKR